MRWFCACSFVNGLKNLFLTLRKKIIVLQTVFFSLLKPIENTDNVSVAHLPSTFHSRECAHASFLESHNWISFGKVRDQSRYQWYTTTNAAVVFFPPRFLLRSTFPLPANERLNAGAYFPSPIVSPGYTTSQDFLFFFLPLDRSFSYKPF